MVVVVEVAGLVVIVLVLTGSPGMVEGKAAVLVVGVPGTAVLLVKPPPDPDTTTVTYRQRSSNPQPRAQCTPSRLAPGSTTESCFRQTCQSTTG